MIKTYQFHPKYPKMFHVYSSCTLEDAFHTARSLMSHGYRAIVEAPNAIYVGQSHGSITMVRDANQLNKMFA